MALLVTISGDNRSSVVKEDSISISQTVEEHLFSCELTLFDADSDITIVAGSYLIADEITIVDGATVYFGGFVANLDVESLEDGSRNLLLQCQGYGILLGSQIIPYTSFQGDSFSDADVIDDLFNAATIAGMPAINSHEAGGVPAGFVVELDAVMNIEFEPMTLLEAMKQISTRTGGQFYVDNERFLHYNTAGGADVGFDLSDEPDQIDSFSYFDATTTTVDASKIVNRVRVLGKAGYPTVVNDAGSQGTYGIHGTIISDETLDTEATRTEAGEAHLAANKDPIAEYTLKTYQNVPAAGLTVDYKNDILGVDANFPIKELHITWEVGDPVYELLLTSLGMWRPPGPGDFDLPKDWGGLGKRSFTMDLVFSSTDKDTVAWADAGTITVEGLPPFVIDAGNTGNMVDVTYIYLDTDISETVLQKSTTASDSVGPNKILVAICLDQPDADQEAVFRALNGYGTLVGEFEISANSIRATHIDVALLTTDELGEWRIGSGTVGVDFTGFRINSDNIVGINDEVDQVIISATTGRLSAGAGVVVLDVDGIGITLAAAYALARSFHFVSGGDTWSGIYARDFGGYNSMLIDIESIAATHSQYNVEVNAPSGKTASFNWTVVVNSVPKTFNMTMSGATVTGTFPGSFHVTGGITVTTGITVGHAAAIVDNQIRLYRDATWMGQLSTNETTWLRINQDIAKNIYTPRSIAAAGALVAGTSIIPHAGDILYTNSLTSYKNGAQFNVAGFLPLAAALTSTSWDGDARGTTAKTKIDLSAVFGAPAGIKAVYCRLLIRDSGAGANDCWILLSPVNTSGLGVGARCMPANDRWMDMGVLVTCDGAGDIYYQIAASAAGAMDVHLQILGYFL